MGRLYCFRLGCMLLALIGVLIAGAEIFIGNIGSMRPVCIGAGMALFGLLGNMAGALAALRAEEKRPGRKSKKG